MDSVERVKTLCKDRRIPIYKLERDCGFSNGYISQLRKGTFPSDRLYRIADYLNVSPSYILTGKEKTDDLSVEQEQLLSYFNSLNVLGRKTAVERVKELSEILRYTEQIDDVL